MLARYTQCQAVLNARRLHVHRLGIAVRLHDLFERGQAMDRCRGSLIRGPRFVAAPRSVAGGARWVDKGFATRREWEMTQSGGPAAINGFLYQILMHLDWLTGVSMSGTLDGHEVKNGLLILEPRTGGDAQAQASDLFLVEQYKTRAKGTWSLTSLADVLRDLRKAVPDSQPERAHYRFVTDGRPGRLEALKSFIGRLNKIESADDLDNGDDAQLHKHALSQRSAFPRPCRGGDAKR